ncbi:MAG TPA: GntR family transcriptional regulator [Streptosporangiaceae bacterium]
MNEHAAVDPAGILPSRRIARDLRQAIEAGELAAGQRLPSERELAARYGTARNTAREAIRLLAAAGLVDVEHGRGVFVHRPAPLLRLGSDRYSRCYRGAGLSPFLLECAKQGMTGRFEVLSIERGRPPEKVADELGVPAGQESVLIRENVFWAGTSPVHRVTTWIPWTIAGGTGLLEAEIPHPYGIHGILEDRGHVMTRQRETVTARMPTTQEEGHLQIRAGVAVLEVWHTSIDQHGIAYELTRFVMRSDLTGLHYDIPVE